MESRSSDAEWIRDQVENAFSMPFVSPAYKSPPIHFDEDIVILRYRIDPDVHAALIPDPLSPTEDPICQLEAVDIRMAEGLGPYQEAIVSVTAQWKGDEYTFGVFIYLDRMPGLGIGREVFGAPKVHVDEIEFKQREKETTRIYRQAGVDNLVITMTMDDRLDNPAEELPFDDDKKRIFRKRIPSVACEEPAIDRIVTNETRDHNIREAWKGRAQVDFTKMTDTPLHLFEPLSEPVGYRVDMDCVVVPSRVLHTYEEYKPSKSK